MPRNKISERCLYWFRLRSGMEITGWPIAHGNDEGGTWFKRDFDALDDEMEPANFLKAAHYWAEEQALELIGSNKLATPEERRVIDELVQIWKRGNRRVSQMEPIMTAWDHDEVE